MSTNCLVTKLKGVVDNDNLLVYNEVKVKVYNSSTNSLFGFKNIKQPFEITALGDLKINGESSLIVSTGTEVWTQNMQFSGLNEGDAGYIIVPNKYKLFSIQGSYDFSENLLDYFDYGDNDVTDFRITTSSSPELKLCDVVKCFPKLTSLFLYCGGIGDISELYALKTTITSLILGTPQKREHITGSFDDFGHLYLINNLRDIVSSTRCGGTIEGFVANRLAEQPGTTGSVSVQWLGQSNLITFEGNPITTKEDNTIAWDAQGNITLS